MVFKHQVLRFLLSGALLWMILFPLVFVCGMAQPLSENTDVSPCCPSKLSQPIESNSVNQPQYQICYLAKSAESHNCTFCPCEYKSGLLQVNVLALIAVSPTDLMPPLVADDIKLFDAQAGFLNVVQHKFDIPSDSGPPIFVGNCTWLI